MAAFGTVRPCFTKRYEWISPGYNTQLGAELRCRWECATLLVYSILRLLLHLAAPKIGVPFEVACVARPATLKRYQGRHVDSVMIQSNCDYRSTLQRISRSFTVRLRIAPFVCKCVGSLVLASPLGKLSLTAWEDFGSSPSPRLQKQGRDRRTRSCFVLLFDPLYRFIHTTDHCH